MKMIKNLLVMVVFASFAVAPVAMAARDAVLAEPSNIALPAGKTYTTAELRKAIISGGARHSWQLAGDIPGKIRLQLDSKKGDYQLVVDVIYDAKNYSVKYVTSQGLRYREESGARMIHSSFGRWMKNLTDAINTELNLLKI
jgi:hypothetical protein